MRDRPLCDHGDHDDGTPWCAQAKEALIARLQMTRIRLGTDFETHGGKKVMFVGNPINWGTPMVPYGTLGTVESTSKFSDKSLMVMVAWDYVTEHGMPNPTYSHAWEEVEVLKTDDNGQIIPGELERAHLKTAPRIMSLALSCPICAGKGLNVFQEHGYWQAWCDAECHAGGPRISDQFPGFMAIAMWNIRGVPDALTKEVRGFPQGDVCVCPFLEQRDVQDAPCPWCLGTKLNITLQQNIMSYHGHCDGCGAFGAWWPQGRYGGGKDYSKSSDLVIEGWKRRGSQKAHSSIEK